MKMRIRVPYGVATTVRLGSVRDITTGQAVVPTFAAGDAKITQDDGVGTDNADNIPVVEGADVYWTISAAEATAIAANGKNRVLQLYDQTNPKVWIDLDVSIETEGNSHLATFPNGVVYGCTPTAKAAGSITLASGADTAVHPVGMVAIITASDEPLDIGAAMIITSFNTGTLIALGADGWTRTPTGTTSALRVALYPNPPAGLIGNMTKVNNVAVGLTPVAVVVGAGSHTASRIIASSATGYSNDRLNGRPMRFTSGALAGMLVKITDYVSATGQIDYENVLGLAGPAAPAETDTAVVE